MNLSVTRRIGLALLALAMLASLFISSRENDVFALPVVSINPDATYYLINKNSGNALDVSNAGSANGTNVQIWEKNGTKAQGWQFVPLGNSQFEILNRWNGMALDVSNAGTSNGTNVHIWERNGTKAQVWKLLLNMEEDATFRLVNPNSNKALDVSNAGTSNGTNVQIWEQNGTDAQNWQLVEIPPPLASLKSVEWRNPYVYVEGDNIKYVQINGRSTTSGWFQLYSKFVGMENGRYKYEVPYISGYIMQVVAYPGEIKSETYVVP